MAEEKKTVAKKTTSTAKPETAPKAEAPKAKKGAGNNVIIYNSSEHK